MPADPPGADDLPEAPRPDPAGNLDATRILTTPPTEATPAASPVQIGTLINNNYRILELLKAGGMGEVYRGENTFTGDPVAIKVVLPSLAHDDKVGALFVREARILCQLADDAIVRYHNFVHDAAIDRYCLIMEFIDGVPLSDHLTAQGALSVDQANRLMEQVAEGLDRAHGSEVIHRDLSPDNVMLRGGATEQPVLIDFGIAKGAEVGEGTLHGQFAGKFRYVSPEQLGHYGGHVGPRTDVYGLGLLIAAAVIGTPLEMGSSVVEAVERRRTIPDLSAVPTPLRPLLAHMLEPDPAARPAGMAEVITMLKDPARIPPRYGGGAQLATVPPTGLRTPPTARSVLTQPGEVASASPFDNAPATVAPRAAPAGSKQKASRWPIWLGLAIAASAGLGYTVWQQGIFAPVASREAPVASPPTPPAATTPEAFLAARSGAACTYLRPGSGSRTDRTIDGFASDLSALEGVIDAYEARFGERPVLRRQTVTEAQCAALDLVAQAKGAPPDLALDTSVLRSGGLLTGRLSGVGDQPVWLALVSAKGGVYNLTEQLQRQADGSQAFEFGLEISAGETSESQLLLAVVSDKPLVSAAAAPNGAVAGQLLPLIAEELSETTGGASLGYLRLVR